MSDIKWTLDQAVPEASMPVRPSTYTIQVSSYWRQVTPGFWTLTDQSKESCLIYMVLVSRSYEVKVIFRAKWKQDKEPAVQDSRRCPHSGPGTHVWHLSDSRNEHLSEVVPSGPACLTGVPALPDTANICWHEFRLRKATGRLWPPPPSHPALCCCLVRLRPCLTRPTPQSLVQESAPCLCLHAHSCLCNT